MSLIDESIHMLNYQQFWYGLMCTHKIMLKIIPFLNLSTNGDDHARVPYLIVCCAMLLFHPTAQKDCCV